MILTELLQMIFQMSLAVYRTRWSINIKTSCLKPLFNILFCNSFFIKNLQHLASYANDKAHLN